VCCLLFRRKVKERAKKGGFLNDLENCMRISICLPDSLRKALLKAANREGVTVNQLIHTALAEKLSAMPDGYLGERSDRGTAEKFNRALGKVKDIEPGEEDQD
jgi:hypothetical protein